MQTCPQYAFEGGTLCMRKCPSFASLRYERCRILGVLCFFRTALMGALHDGFCSLARKGALYAGSVLALVVATQEATNKDSNDLWYSTEMQSTPDAARGQKTHAVRPSIMHWRRGGDHPWPTSTPQYPPHCTRACCGRGQSWQLRAGGPYRRHPWSARTARRRALGPPYA